MRRDFIVICACVGWGSAGACEGAVNEPGSPKMPAIAVTEVVAKVGGRAIGAEAVRERMTLDRVSAETALNALVEEELLLQAAHGAGFRGNPEGEGMRKVDRTMVRALLHELEQENMPEAIPAQQVRKEFEQSRDRFQVLERRGSWHVLVKVDTEEARKLASAVLSEARRADDPREVFDRYATGGGADHVDVPVVVEELPAITMKAEIEKPYKNALFKAKSTGPLNEPVQTSYGWHAIVLTEIQPGEVRTFADVEAQIRDRLSQKKRFEKLVEVVTRLEAEQLVDYDEAVVKRLMSAREVPKRAE